MNEHRSRASLHSWLHRLRDVSWQDGEELAYRNSRQQKGKPNKMLIATASHALSSASTNASCS